MATTILGLTINELAVHFIEKYAQVLLDKTAFNEMMGMSSKTMNAYCWTAQLDSFPVH